MLKQTVLKFQGALGLLGFGSKEGGKDGDSGNSSATGFSNDYYEQDIYLSTGVLSAWGHPLSNIHVARYSTAQIGALIDGYKAKRGNIRQLCRVFDPEEVKEPEVIVM